MPYPPSGSVTVLKAQGPFMESLVLADVKSKVSKLSTCNMDNASTVSSFFYTITLVLQWDKQGQFASRSYIASVNSNAGTFSTKFSY